MAFGKRTKQAGKPYATLYRLHSEHTADGSLKGSPKLARGATPGSAMHHDVPCRGTPMRVFMVNPNFGEVAADVHMVADSSDGYLSASEVMEDGGQESVNSGPYIFCCGSKD
jgi:hypothetical protein